MKQLNSPTQNSLHTPPLSSQQSPDCLLQKEKHKYNIQHFYSNKTHDFKLYNQMVSPHLSYNIVYSRYSDICHPTVDVILPAFMNEHNIVLNNLAANQQVIFFQNVPQCSRMHLNRTAILTKVYIIVPAGTMILLGVQIEHSRDIDQRVQA